MLPSACPCCGADASHLSSPHSVEQFLDVVDEAPNAREFHARFAQDQQELFDSFVQCSQCGHMHTSPFPSLDTLSDFYQAYGGNASYAKKQKRKLQRAKRRITKLARHTVGRRFLDIGCNVGFAVESARTLGFEARGIDLDAGAIEIARELWQGATFSNTTISDHAQRPEHQAAYDLIYCTEVIEHVPDIQAFVSSAYALTAPGGLFFITTPDAGHWRRPKQFLEWDEVKPPEHLHWFTRESIRHLLTAAGFDTVRFMLSLKANMKVMARRRA